MTTQKLSCPALFVAAPASGQGKTTVVAALARLHTRLGRRVRVFKCGPDFLDPQIHAIASGAPCQNVDLWMCGADDIAWRLAEAARDALGLSPDEWVVGNVGRLHPDKDQATLLKGFALALPHLPAQSRLAILKLN